MKATSSKLTRLAFLLMIIVGCRHEIPIGNLNGGNGNGGGNGGGGGTSGSPCSPDTIYFMNSILPLISSNCAQSGCHNGNSGGDAGEYILNTYDGIRRVVVAGNSSNSKLIDVILNGNMPPVGYGAITPSQITSISRWINQGALNNSCTSTSCDTANITYSNSISSILQTSCTGCHSGTAAAGGGINLTTYLNVKLQVDNGKLWGDVSHATGYNAMPLGGLVLSTCDLNIIDRWIKSGAPNN